MVSLAVIAVAVLSSNTANAQAVIAANPNNIEFYGHESLSDSLSKSVSIENTGDGDLNWTASWSAWWMTAFPASGTAPSSLTITVSPETLFEGDYIDTIWIESPEATNSPYPIKVKFNVYSCTGLCGDMNADGNVNISDAIYMINYVFIGGDKPQPVLACGDANSDGAAALSDGILIINYIFIGGSSPGDCSPGSWEGAGGNCCPFEL
jgi:hypothetical protein